MPFRPVQTEKLSSAVVRQIELLVLQPAFCAPVNACPPNGNWQSAWAYPPSLRDAIGALQADGLLSTKAGAGVFVADVLGSSFAPALIRLFARHDEAVFDYLSFRRDMEGLAAERAARLGSDTDLKVVQAVFDKMETAHAKRSPEEEARLDAQFHMAIIEASHNVVMLHMMRSMYDLLREGVFYNRQVMFKQRTTRGMLLEQHRAINDALQARDGAAARAAVDAHMDFIQTALQDRIKARQNEDIAQRRLDHEVETG